MLKSYNIDFSLNKSLVNKRSDESILIIKKKNIEKDIKFIILFTSFILILIPDLKNKNVCCMCAIAKEENRYIKEFVGYYKNYYLDKIYLYDNNDINGEKFDDVIGDYIKSGFVEIVNYRGLQTPQRKAYNDCYRKHNRHYNWLIFYDIDEYIYLKDYKNITKFLEDKRFEKCERVQLNYILHTDNNLMFYDNRSIHERFPEVDLDSRIKNPNAQLVFKSILRGNLHNIHIYDPHILARNVISCDGYGKRRKVFENKMDNPDYDNYYIDHFFCKSLEEFVDKITKTDVFYKKDVRMEKIRLYFSFNIITKEKLDYLEEKTKLDLSEFRQMIK